MADSARGSPARFDDVHRLLAGAVGEVFPAAQLVVVDRGAVVQEAAVGACDRGTLFDVASLTKPLVTTTLVMRHLDAGRLTLEDELRPGVTIAHALAHATGLPAWLPLYERCAAAAELRPAIVDHLRHLPLEATPGSRSLYSDLGFILLGDRVEAVGSARLDEQFAPLAATFAPGATFDPDPARCAPTRRGDPSRPPSDDELALAGTVHDDNALAMEGVAGHAGLFATAGDVAALAAALVASWCDCTQNWCSRIKPRLAAPATVRRFLSPCGVPGSSWCLGWDRPSTGASQAGRRWPRDGVGHLGFTGCSLWIDPPRGRWVVLLSNRVFLGPGAEGIKSLRPALHDAIVLALDGG